MRHQYSSGVCGFLRIAHACRPHRGVRSHHSTAGCLICSESHMSELPHRDVRSHHSMAGCVILSLIFEDVSREFDEFQVNTHLCKLRCWYS